ncbi:hypothetical protein QYF61_010093, partial [Mycteria americana]
MILKVFSNQYDSVSVTRLVFSSKDTHFPGTFSFTDDKNRTGNEELEKFSQRLYILQEEVKHLFKSTIQTSAPRLDSYEWQGVWDSMGKYLGQWAPPMFWNFTPEQVQDPEKLVKCLEKVCCHPGNSREAQITETCWGLAHAYRALLNAIQYPQREEKVSGSDDKATGTTATPAPPATGTAATPNPPATGTAATSALATDTAVEPGNQPVSVSVAPMHKKKSWKRKSARLER